MPNSFMLIDALQYINPSRHIFEQMRKANLAAVHVTVGYHEEFDGVVENLAKWNRLIEDNGNILRRGTCAGDIDAAQQNGQTAVFFGLQNPLPIAASLHRIETLHHLGVRFCQVTYNQQSLLGAGCFEPHDSGLTAFGREVVIEMNRIGMVIDLSHAGHKTAMDVIAASTRPVTVTHANPHRWHAAPRNLQDELIAALANTGGMMGFSLYPHHLNGGSDCTMQNFAQMAQEMMAKYGPEMFGIGSDLCQDQPDSVVNWMRNGYWRKTPAPAAAFPAPPVWFRDNSDHPAMALALRDHGITQPHVDGLMGQNWYNFFKTAFDPS